MIGLILACMVIGNFMSHTATAAVFAPIAIQMASTMNRQPITFLMAVGPGDCVFKDYFKLGWPIQLIAAFLLIVFVPIFIPFTKIIP